MTTRSPCALGLSGGGGAITSMLVISAAVFVLEFDTSSVAAAVADSVTDAV